MRSRALAHDHEAAVARRLELLSAELAAVRGGSSWPDTRPRAVGEDDPVPEPGPAESWTPRGYTRIRAVPDDEWVDEEPDPTVATPVLREPRGGVPPVRARMPGRHASRRFGGGAVASLADHLPETLRGRVALAPGPLAVVAVLVALGLTATCWWLLRGQSSQVIAPVSVSTPRAALASPVAAGGAGGGPAGGPAGAASASASARVVVDVAGKVRHPGIAVLRSGARVVDAIRAAGGARPGVDLSALNLAQVLTDGQQIVVGTGVAAAPVASASTGGSPVGTLVNLNTADETTLESLPEVGPVTAQAIITWRTQNGGFNAVSQLLEVDGIGDATLAKLTPYVTI